MNIRHSTCLAALICLGCLSVQTTLWAVETEANGQADFPAVVRAYADALLEQGRDVYGKEKSPLFATTLDRGSLRLFEGNRLQEIRSIPREGWDEPGLHDRAP